jgi:hypothetical protein
VSPSRRGGRRGRPRRPAARLGTAPLRPAGSAHLPRRRVSGRRPLERAGPDLRGRAGWPSGPSTAPGLENATGGAAGRAEVGGGHTDATICSPLTGTGADKWSSKRCARPASISRSELMRTSATVARSTMSSLVNVVDPRVLSRRANSCMSIMCSYISSFSCHRCPSLADHAVRRALGVPRVRRSRCRRAGEVSVTRPRHRPGRGSPRGAPGKRSTASRPSRGTRRGARRGRRP